MEKVNAMFSLEGKVALVTGASYGIGFALATAFARQGAKIVFNDIKQELVDKGLAAYKAEGIEAKGYVCDVTSEEQVNAMVAQIEKEVGIVDILVNNAGITRDGLLMRMGKDQWDAVIKTNLDSVFNLTKAVQRTMLKQRSGSIINMSSVVGIKGNAGQANYAASKAGIIGFTKSVALELGSRGIRCNAIAPGFIETEMTGALDPKVVEGWTEAIPLKRAGTVEDIANACLFLGSDLSTYVTGQVLSVNGGMLT